MSWLSRLLPWRRRPAELEDLEQVRAWHRAGRPVSLSSWAELSQEVREALEAAGCASRLEELRELVGALSDPELLEATAEGAEALEDLLARRLADVHAEGGPRGPRRLRFAGVHRRAEEEGEARDLERAASTSLFGQPAQVLSDEQLGRVKRQETVAP